MIVVVLSDCPPKLRGDISKWLFEVNTGVYVGELSARVRDALWDRICGSIKTGRATMVFSASGEQGLDYRVHNTTWVPVDLDGIKLMRHPHAGTVSDSYHFDDSPFQRPFRRSRHKPASHHSVDGMGDFCVLDIETDGLSCTENRILEAAAIRVRGWKIESEWSSLVFDSEAAPLPAEITALTQITDEMLSTDGIPLDEVMNGLFSFIGNDRVICHNRTFDYAFLQSYCKATGKPLFKNPGEDTLQMAKRTIRGLMDYKLETVAEYYGIDTVGHHRALPDCRIAYGIYLKMNEK